MTRETSDACNAYCRRMYSCACLSSRDQRTPCATVVLEGTLRIEGFIFLVLCRSMELGDAACACLSEWRVESVSRCVCVQVTNGASQAAVEAADGSGTGGEERYTRLPPVNSAGLAKLQVGPQNAKLLMHEDPCNLGIGILTLELLSTVLSILLRAEHRAAGKHD